MIRPHSRQIALACRAMVGIVRSRIYLVWACFGSVYLCCCLIPVIEVNLDVVDNNMHTRQQSIYFAGWVQVVCPSHLAPAKPSGSAPESRVSSGLQGVLCRGDERQQ